MLNLEKDKDKQAWDIASDPSAPEHKWLAACTVLEGKNHIATVPKLPGWIALPYGLVVSGAGAGGAVVMFALTQLIVSAKVGEFFAAPAASNVAAAVCIWLVPCFVFTQLFTYQRMMAEGGVLWKTTQWTLVVGYLSMISYWAIAGQPLELADAGLLAFWNIACIGASYVGSLLAEYSYGSLQSTIGARKVVIPMVRSFAAIPLAVGAIIFSCMNTGFYLSPGQMLLALGGIVIGATYLTVKSVNATKATTARRISTFMWTPIILSNMMLLPAIATTDIWLTVTGQAFINWVDYAGAYAALGISAALPLVGGMIASKHLQAKAALGLERGGDHRFLSTESDTTLPTLAPGSAET